METGGETSTSSWDKFLKWALRVGGILVLGAGGGVGYAVMLAMFSFGEMTGKVAQQGESLAVVQKSFSEIRDDITQAASSFNDVKTDVARNEESLAIVQKSFSEIRDDITHVKNDVAQNRESLAVLEQNYSRLRDDVSDLKASQSRMEGSLDMITRFITKGEDAS